MVKKISKIDLHNRLLEIEKEFEELSSSSIDRVVIDPDENISPTCIDSNAKANANANAKANANIINVSDDYSPYDATTTTYNKDTDSFIARLKQLKELIVITLITITTLMYSMYSLWLLGKDGDVSSQTFMIFSGIIGYLTKTALDDNKSNKE